MRDVSFEAKIERSSWVTARILPSSHSNPIFVLVGEKPIRASRRSAQWCLKGVDQCWSQKERFLKGDELEFPGQPPRTLLCIARHQPHARVMCDAQQNPGMVAQSSSPPCLKITENSRNILLVSYYLRTVRGRHCRYSLIRPFAGG